MSTRCNVLVKDNYSKIWIYRHSDGYPSGVHPTLSVFIQNIIDGKIRDNPGQSAGWLILLGAKEYDVSLPSKTISGWKCGAYEPTCGEHGDIEYLYTVDLENRTVKISGSKNITYSFEDYVKLGANEDE